MVAGEDYLGAYITVKCIVIGSHTASPSSAETHSAYTHTQLGDTPMHL